MDQLSKKTYLLFLYKAKLALDSLEVPVRKNPTNETRNATRHAEMKALAVLLEQWERTGLLAAEVAEKFSVCSLYVTCELCITKINGAMGILDKRVSSVVDV
ncbi:hypothetical protein BT93_L0288 [Corymbia citriodora subsp. variegata]|uniref:Uncharacterized protein n=1 Tax=Corymbia citriodora subsp. variegata TaxID=360336 RepID=A0A8T0CTZ1_CORYI|nr:hypothetical protein BT93_L0288 [Corymbia citriodora subsp. variegata]